MLLYNLGVVAEVNARVLCILLYPFHVAFMFQFSTLLTETMMPEASGRQFWIDLVGLCLPALAGLETFLTAAYGNILLARITMLFNQFFFCLCIFRVCGEYFKERFIWVGSVCLVAPTILILVRYTVLVELYSYFTRGHGDFLYDCFELLFFENPFLRASKRSKTYGHALSDVQQNLIIGNFLVPWLFTTLAGWLLHVRCPVPDEEVEPILSCCPNSIIDEKVEEGKDTSDTPSEDDSRR